MKKNILLCVAFSYLTACGTNSSSTPAVETVAKNSVDSLSCDDFQSVVWDRVKDYLIEQQEIPSALQISAAVKNRLTFLQAANPQITQVQINTVALDLEQLFKAIIEESVAGENATTAQQLLVLISAIDVGDKTTAFRTYMVDKTQSLFAKVNADVQNLGLNCAKSFVAEETPTFERHQLEALQAGEPLAVLGQRWAFATAYQSCGALRLPAMTSQTPNVKGISIVGKHSDGVGSRRTISSLNDVISTHNYIKDERSYAAGCFDLRKKPLIYDYGGKPYATTASDSSIDMFRNNGDGTSVLGIDCSGYVFTSMASAGLKLKSSRPLKASDAWAWGSSSYVEPQKNGLTCLDKITLTPDENLKAGDIVAVYGHVFMIDSIGEDPFGIQSTRSLADCAKIGAKNFDFVVSQSSNSKNGIGINRFQARDFVGEKGGEIQKGLVKYANYACQAHYNKKNYTPSIGTLSVVRHNGKKECLATRVKLSREECISSCADFTNLSTQ